MKSIQLILSVALFTLVAVSCSNSRVTSSWKTAHAASLSKEHKILVLGIIQEKDMRLRMQMEGFLVDALKEKAYNAVSAYTLYGPKQFGKMDEQAVLNQLRSSGIDEVLTISLLDRSRERQYTPGAGFYPYSPFWDYYSFRYNLMYGPGPGYYSLSTRYFWESNLYDVKSKNLLYSVQSETFDPSSSSDMGRTYSRIIVKNMMKEGLLAKR